MKWKEKAKLICEFKIKYIYPEFETWCPRVLSSCDTLSCSTSFRPRCILALGSETCKRSFSKDHSLQKIILKILQKIILKTSHKWKTLATSWKVTKTLSSVLLFLSFSSSSSSANWCWQPELPRIEIQVSKSSFVHNNNKLQKAEAVAVEGFRFEANVKRRTISFWLPAHTIVHLG